MKDVTFTRFGITLRTMQEDDLELVRMQRNRPDMRALMTTDHEITREEMENWFKSLPQDYYYFMVEWEGRIVGQVNLKGIDETTADPGLIFWDDGFANKTCVAILAFYEYAFKTLGYKRFKGIIVKDNKKSLRLNKGLGFKFIGEGEIKGKQVVYTELTATDFDAVLQNFLNVFTEA